MNKDLSTLLDRVAQIQPIIENCRAETEQNRRVSDTVYAALRDQKLHTLLVPKALGGMEVDPITAYKVWEMVAKIDSATAWNLAQSNGGLMMSARLPVSGLEKIFSDGIPMFAGASYPPAQAERVDGGFSVTGRTPFVSGCHQADWFFVSMIVVNGGKPETDTPTGAPIVKLGYFPRAVAEILDTWHTMGMRGTGSGDVRLTGVFIPDDLVAPLMGKVQPAPAFSAPLYQLAPWPVIQGEAVVALGVTAAAIDLFVELAGKKTPTGSGTLLRDRELIHYNLGRARTLLDASRAYAYQATSDALSDIEAGKSLTLDHQVSIMLAGCNAAESCAKAVGLIFDMAGSSGFRTEMGFERLFRDVHVITQHATKSSSRYVSAGRVFLGLTPDTAMLTP